MNRICITLPKPPTVNQLYRNVPRKGRVRTEHYNRWRQHAGWLVQAERFRPINGRYRFCLEIHEDDPADVDGRVKAVLDLFVWLGLTGDDRLCWSCHTDRVPAVEPGSVNVTIEEI
jgi:Holliday junction resolvase RusA-like endonuclease